MAQIIRTLFDLLSAPAEYQADTQAILTEREISSLIEQHLNAYNMAAEVFEICQGPVFTVFKLQFAPGVSTRRLSSLRNDLSRLLCISDLSVIDDISGTPYSGIKILNPIRQLVYLRKTLGSLDECTSSVKIALGVNIQGQPVTIALSSLSHLLIGGISGAGKSVLLNSIILSVLCRATPDEIRILIIDPRAIDFPIYEGLPHLLTPVVTDSRKALNALRWITAEMDSRFMLMSVLGVDNLSEYNKKIEEANYLGRPIPNPFFGQNKNTYHAELTKLYEIVIVIDDFIDLMIQTNNVVEEIIIPLIQKSYIVGIHLILSVQRPSSDIISKYVKVNIPARIALTVTSKSESRSILDQNGAEELLGEGDMLFTYPGLSQPLRLHGAFLNDNDVRVVTQYWKEKQGSQYIDHIQEEKYPCDNFDNDDADPLFDEAVSYVIENRKASISGIQRFLRIGYSRAARIIEKMESLGVISAQGHNGNREVLAPPICKPNRKAAQKNNDIFNVTTSDADENNTELNNTQKIIEVHRKRGILSRIADLWRK